MTFDGAKFQWRGQRWDFVQAAVKIPVGKENSNSPIDIDHVRIGHGGRKAEIAGAFDPASRVIRISKFDSGIDLLALARAMMPDAVGSLSAVSTSGAWRSAVRERSRWITLRTSAGMVTWRSMATSSMRAAKQTSRCRSRLFQCAWRSRW